MDQLGEVMTPERLRKFMELRRLSESTLSSSSSIEPERLKAILSGAEVSLRELRQLAAVLKVTMDDLSLAEGPSKSADFLYRSVKRAKDADPALITSLSKRLDMSLELLRTRQVQHHWGTEFANADTYANAEENAAKFRTLFFSGDQESPLLRLPQIAVATLDVLLFVVDQPAIDGASARLGGRNFIFVSRRFEGRMLFTLAHELAHILSHHINEEEYAIFDDHAESGGKSAGSVRGAENHSEKYAHAFASCLLMPGAGIGVVLKKLREKSTTRGPLTDVEVLWLSRIFGVSFMAAARRCEDLTLLPTGGASSLDDYLKREFGSAEKRAAAIGLPPRPTVDFPSIPLPLLESAIQQIKEGNISVGRAASQLGVSIFDLISFNEMTVH
jgi:Zn-dependent peptidase ImmA (M78 family)/predicted HTH domain antitoxin